MAFNWNVHFNQYISFRNGKSTEANSATAQFVCSMCVCAHTGSIRNLFYMHLFDSFFATLIFWSTWPFYLHVLVHSCCVRFSMNIVMTNMWWDQLHRVTIFLIKHSRNEHPDKTVIYWYRFTLLFSILLNRLLTMFLLLIVANTRPAPQQWSKSCIDDGWHKCSTRWLSFVRWMSIVNL